MELKTIPKKRIYHDIIKQMQEAIEKGQVKPGQRFPSERKLAQLLSVSRTSVKEAISVLDSSGVVSIKPGIGVFLRDDGMNNILYDINVILKDSFDLVEILELRQAVESDAAYYAALRREPEDLAKIENAFTALEDAVTHNKLAADEDYIFHMEICKAAGNVLLQKVILYISDTLIDSLRESRSQTLKIPGRSKAVLEEHREIFKTIRNGDKSGARRNMWEHLQNVKRRFR